jgi:hypothetical protein
VTEAEWLACTDSEKMLEFLRGRASDRQLRLLAVAYARRRFGNLAPLEVAERYADGLTDQGELGWAESEAYWYVVGNCTDISGQVTDQRDWSLSAAAGDNAAQAVGVIAWGEEDARRAYENLGRVPEASPLPALLREFFGNPFRSVPFNPAWRTPDVSRLAASAYDQRSVPAGHLDPAGLTVLADALEEAGCTGPDLLGHLRGPGPHVRGCWAVDLLLGKQ